MPVATIDTFKRILLKPDNVTLEANVVGDSLALVAGSGITLTANGGLDEITITNSASLGLVTLDNVLLSGNSSSRTATVGRLNVDNIIIDSNAIQFSDSTIQNTAWTGLPTASNSVLGGVKIDASSITINGSGVISVPAVATIGQNNGIATLGADGKLTSAQIPTSLSGAIIFKGTWNATTNTPTLVDGTGQNGWQYTVTIAGTVNLGSGSITFVPGDFIIYNGSIWQKIAANTIAAAGTLTGATLASGVTASSLTSVGTLTNLTVTNTITGSITGNAGTVTNGVYTTDTGTVTNTMLSGSIANTKLTNSSVTVGSTAVSLGSTVTTFSGLTSVTSTTFVGALTGSISGNAATVTNGVYTTDTGTVTNTMLSGSIANTKLTNSSVTIGSTAVSLGSTVTTFSGLTSVTSTTFVGALTGSISGNAATVTNGVYTTDTGTVTNTMLSGSIANNKLTNSTISSKALGTNLDTLTLNTSGTGLSGSTTYNGSGAATFTVASNATSANTVSAIVARDANGNFSAGTITATITGSVSGNAGTVTNGVYTTGSYADPAWITSLAASKVGLGSVTNESKATMFASPTFTGTVSGVTATHVGLGNVTNESKATMFSSPTFTGTVASFTVKDSILASTTVAGGTFNLCSNLTGFQGLSIAGGNLTTGTDKYVYIGTGGIALNGNHATSTTEVHIGGNTSGSLTKIWSPLTVIGNIGATNLSGTNTGDQTIPTTLPASDVYAWAKAATKPSYTATEVGLGSVTNESKATMFASPTFTGTATAPTFSGALSGNASSATTFSTGRTNYKTVTDASVAGQLMWKNYGNNHTIFDASAGTSPEGGAVNNTSAAIAWAATYPTLMGWNGASTYGVRVDSARIADGAPANDVYSWAKAATKPSYTATEVGLGNVNNTADANKAVSSASTATTAANLVGGNIYSNSSGQGYSTAVQVREASVGGAAQGTGMAFAPRLAFHWGGVVASSIAVETSGRIGIFNNPGTAYENLICAAFNATSGTFSGAISASNFSGSSSGTNTGDQTLPTTLPASDVYAWAKAATKPSYTATEVGLSNVGNYTVNQNVGTGNDVTFNNVTAAAFYYSSDATLKTNIGTLTNYWETLDALRPVSFDWISNGKKDLGLLAQDVQSVMPESVTTTNDGTLAISSSGIIANLVAAVKDLKQQVEELTKQLKGNT